MVDQPPAGHRAAGAGRGELCGCYQFCLRKSLQPSRRPSIYSQIFMCHRHVTSVLRKCTVSMDLGPHIYSRVQTLTNCIIVFWKSIQKKYIRANISVNALLMFEKLLIPMLTIFIVPANGRGHHS